MGAVKMANGYYFLYWGIAAVYLMALIIALHRASRKTARIVLLVLLFLNFLLHYLKQAFPPYVYEFPKSLRMSAMQNLCAVSTVLFPFIFLIKKHNILHDFMFFMGVTGGLAALAYPTEALNMPPFAFDTVRFYICHMTLAVVPLAAAVLGIHRPRLSRFWAIPLMFLVWEAIICLNDFFLVWVGLVEGEFSDLFNAGFHNSSFTFGVRPDFAWATEILHPFVPRFLRTDYFNLNGGKPFYFPVLWLTGPAFVYLIPIYAVISSPFALADYIKRRKAARQSRISAP